MHFEEFKAKFEKAPVDVFPNRVQDNPVVSVCVQTYQHVNYIKECLDGILMQQTTFPFEILLGEDESKDGTREICIEYAQKYPDKIRLFLHHRENNIKINGISTGRFNFLYNLFCSRGKYIAVCEGDDYWTDPLKLQKQVNEMEANLNINICSHPSIKIDDKSKKVIGTAGDCGKIKRILSIKDVILNFGAKCPMQAILIRNVNLSFFVDLILDSPGAHGLLTVFWSHPDGVLYLPEPMAIYRTNTSTSIMSNFFRQKNHHFIFICETNKKLLDINNYFNGVYSEEIHHRIKKYQHSLIISNNVSLKNKLSLINNNKEHFPFHLILILFFKNIIKVVVQQNYYRIRSMLQ
jgi:glycosyltransferase involved in cell wall biosynthesis